MKAINWIAYVLVVVGGLNWLLVGLFDYNLVNAVLGSISWLEKLVYILVGLGAVLALFSIRPVAKRAGMAQPVA